MADRTVLSYCRICAAACGITVSLDGDRVTKVRGDGDHPASRGYTCVKGRGLGAFHHGPDRLDRPRIAGTAAGWPHALDDLAAALTTVREDAGPGAIGLYLATGLAYDAAGQVAAPTWLASIGSGSFYSAATVDNAPVLVAAELVAGHAMLNPVWDPTGAGLLVLIGTNPVVSHGYGTTLPDPVRRLRDFRADGGRIWVVDPRRSESAALADEHLSPQPGSDVWLLAAVAAELLRSGADPDELTGLDPEQVASLRTSLERFTLASAAEVAGVALADLERLVEDIRSAQGRVAIQCGTGTTMARDGILVEWLRWVVLILTGSLDRPGGMRFHDGPFGRLRAKRGTRTAAGPASRPELGRVAGQVPAVALVDEIEAGNLRALVVTGGNPITSLPDPTRTRAALRRLDVLAVVDVVENELTGIATHVLPATGQLERADLTLASTTSVRSAVQTTRPVVTPGAERRASWWMFAELGNRMGADLLDGVDPSSLDDEAYLRRILARSPIDVDAVWAAGPRGHALPVEDGWVRETMLVDRRWNLTPPPLLQRLDEHVPPSGRVVLTPRREPAWSNSVRYAETAPAEVRMNPGDARAAGIIDGGTVVLTSAHGELVATAVLEEGVRTGVLSVTHGHPEASPGSLTSTAAGVDRLTAMPHASGVPVEIRPAQPR